MSEFDKERFFELVKILHRIVDLLGWNIEKINGLARCIERQGIDALPYLGFEEINEARQCISAAITEMHCAYVGIEKGIRKPVPPSSVVFRREDDATLREVAEREAERSKQVLAALAKAIEARKDGAPPSPVIVPPPEGEEKV